MKFILLTFRHWGNPRPTRTRLCTGSGRRSSSCRTRTGLEMLKGLCWKKSKYSQDLRNELGKRTEPSDNLVQTFLFKHLKAFLQTAYWETIEWEKQVDNLGQSINHLEFDRVFRDGCRPSRRRGRRAWRCRRRRKTRTCSLGSTRGLFEADGSKIWMKLRTIDHSFLSKPRLWHAQILKK